ncbi:hypothetical protein, partial [Methylobacterium soli]|uniref:hypothetical protein n=1 Tax=Methylobacterium soli TaxID=553447 RepID=UPI001EE2769D
NDEEPLLRSKSIRTVPTNGQHERQADARLQVALASLKKKYKRPQIHSMASYFDPRKTKRLHRASSEPREAKEIERLQSRRRLQSCTVGAYFTF